jgi:hypothetical protein
MDEGWFFCKSKFSMCASSAPHRPQVKRFCHKKLYAVKLAYKIVVPVLNGFNLTTLMLVTGFVNSLYAG